MPLTNLQTRAVETLVHPYTNQATFRDTGPLVFERGKGVYIYDTEGKPYLLRTVYEGTEYRTTTSFRDFDEPLDIQAPKAAEVLDTKGLTD